MAAVERPHLISAEKMSCILYMGSSPLSDLMSNEIRDQFEVENATSSEINENYCADGVALSEKFVKRTITTTSTTVKKFRNVRKSSIFSCLVCGDKPTGYHYDVLSCNGCKTFFRRTIINSRNFYCAKGGKCQFNKDFRCACRACRFEKCINVGMNAKGIQFPNPSLDQGMNGRPTLCTNMNSFQERAAVEGFCSYIPAGTKLNNISYLDLRCTDDFQLMNVIGSLVNREHSTKHLRKLVYPIFCESTLKKLLKEPSIIGRRKFEKESSNSQIDQYRENPIKFWMVADLFLAVEYAKTFKRFANLCESDQQKLLGHAGGLIQIASQAFYTLEQKEESITFPDGINALRLQLQNRKYQFEKFYRESYSRPVAVIRSLSMTREQFALFKAILLFSPSDFLFISLLRFLENIRPTTSFVVVSPRTTVGRRIRCSEGMYEATASMPKQKSFSVSILFQEVVIFECSRPEQYLDWNSLREYDLDLTPRGRREIDSERERLTFILRKCLLHELGASLAAEKLANILLAIASFVDISEKRRNYLEVCDLLSTMNLSSLAKGVYLKQFDL